MRIPFLLLFLLVVVLAVVTWRIGPLRSRATGNQVESKEVLITPTSVASLSRSSIQYKTETIKEENDKDQYKIDISYPQFSGLSDKTVEKDVNAKIKQKIEAVTAEFKKNASENNSLVPSDIQSNLTITFNVVAINENSISIDMRGSIYIRGAAHPYSQVMTFNYDLSHKKELTILEILKSPNDLPAFAAIVQQALLDKNKQNPITDEEWIKTGTAAEPENFDHFLLKQHELVVVFDQYQIAAGVAGVQQVEIPYSTLEKNLLTR